MTKKLFIVAVMMLSASILYYGFQKFQSDTSEKTQVTNTSAPQNSAAIGTTTSEFEGIYTAAGDEKDCRAKRMTLEILASSTSYLTEEFLDCKTKKEIKSWEGSWKQESEALNVDLKNGAEEQKLNSVISKNVSNIMLQSTNPKISFLKTNFKNYKSEYKNISAEYGQYGEEYFVRLWAPNGVLLATLARDSVNNSRYTDGTYVWEMGATSTLLSASSTNETFIEQHDE